MERQRNTMAEFRWIHMSLFLMLLLHFTAAVTGQLISLLVREGEDVTLPCNDVTDDRDECGHTSWTLTGSTTSGPVELVTHGKINETAKDRLSVTESCSLVIKKVTAQDAGQYGCHQPRSGHSHRYLFIVNMTEEKDDDGDEDGDEDDAEVTLTCSVSAPVECRHTVKWLFEGKDVKKVMKPQTSQSGCSAKVTRNKKSEDPELFKCEVFDNHGGKVQQFIFSPQSSGEDGKKKTTRTPTVKPATEATPAVTSSPATATEPNATSPDCSALTFIMLLMRVAELLLITVITVLLLRAAGNQRPADDNTVSGSVRSPGVMPSGPAASQTHSDEDEDDGRVSYENFADPSSSVRLR